MENICKIISVFSTKAGLGKREYAVHLTAALTEVTKAKVVFIEEHFEKVRIEEIRNSYQYVIMNLPEETDESLYEMFFSSDTIHLLVDPDRDKLKDAHMFLQDLLKKGLEDIYRKIKVVINRLNVHGRLSVEEMTWLLKKDIWAVVPDSKAILRIAKSESDKLLGLALGSGAAFGIAHIGVLKVLEQNRIVIDIVSGSSIGALIAGMVGMGLSTDKIEHIAKKLRSKLDIMRLLDFTVPVSGILAGKRLKRFLTSIFGEKTFEDLQIPVKIIVYDLANRETITIENGLVMEAVYKSITVPGIFAPEVENGRTFIDGGISDPVPVDILLKGGVKKIIAVNVLPGPEDIYKRNMFLKRKREEEQHLMQAAPFYRKAGLAVKKFLGKIFTPNIFDVIMTSMQSLEYVLAENSCKKANVALHPVLHSATSIDFHLVNDFVKIGTEEANQHIEEIKELAKK